MARKPSWLLRTGLVLAMAGAVLVFTSLLLGPEISAAFAYGGGAVMLAGAAALLYGGVAYARRFKELEQRREQIHEQIAQNADQNSEPEKPA